MFAESASSSWTGRVTFCTDYRSRGISQTFLRPAVQPELTYTHKTGWYCKTWASNVDGTGNFINNTSLEWDLYVGLKKEFLPQWTYDIGFLFYFYPEGHAKVPSNVSYNTVEYYASIKYKKLEFKISVTLGDFFGVNSANPPLNWFTFKFLPPNGHSHGSPYLEINYDYSLNSKWTASFHLGYQQIAHYSQLNYVDWLFKLERQFDLFAINLSYVQTNAKKVYFDVLNNAHHPRHVNLGGAGVIVGIFKTF